MSPSDNSTKVTPAEVLEGARKLTDSCDQMSADFTTYSGQIRALSTPDAFGDDAAGQQARDNYMGADGSGKPFNTLLDGGGELVKAATAYGPAVTTAAKNYITVDEALSDGFRSLGFPTS